MDSFTDLFKPSFLKDDKAEAFPEEISLAMAYVPLQLELIVYDGDKGLENGTIFPALNKPFCGRMVKNEQG